MSVYLVSYICCFILLLLQFGLFLLQVLLVLGFLFCFLLVHFFLILLHIFVVLLHFVLALLELVLRGSGDVRLHLLDSGDACRETNKTRSSTI